MRQRRLADAGQVFDQQVAARQQAGQRQADLRVLAENDLIGGIDDFSDGRLFFGRLNGCR